MSIRLFNTLSRQVDEIAPLHPPAVGIYTCGPTVYDYAHIGHWFNYVRMDMLVRTLKASGYNPQWVMNITDVGHLTSDADEGEDKLEKGARREGKSAWQVAAFYTEDFFEGMRLLNLLQPDNVVKATDHIAEQIALISQLEQKGYTYEIAHDGIYYDTSKFPTYGAFARLDTDEQQAGSRVRFNPAKRNISDFALWKFSPPEQRRDMEWDSPWGKGFPGWHIECSAMSLKYLGPTLDIHTGGIDHIPIHHTNEIAQSEAVTGQRFANYWLHSNHVMVDNEKISKSLGNGIRLSEIMQKGITPQAIRLHILESHYRSQSKFSYAALEASAARLRDLEALAVLRWQGKETANADVLLANIYPTVLGHLQNDLNTPQALAYVSQISNQLQTSLLSPAQAEEFGNILAKIDDLLGTTLSAQADISEKTKALIRERDGKRAQQDWVAADAIRDQLSQDNIALRDSEYGTIWYRSA